jgi:hypothetical protein
MFCKHSIPARAFFHSSGDRDASASAAAAGLGFYIIQGKRCSQW